MLANVGPLDRWIRITAGAGLLAAALYGPKVDWGWIGLYPLLTGLARHCPFYALFRINSCGR